MAAEKMATFLDKLELSAEERKKIEETFSRAKYDVHILVVGKTGMGKSMLVNALSGAEVAPVGRGVDPDTPSVTRYHAQTKDGYTINAWDTPGFFDGSGRDYQYVESIKERCGDRIDILLYCVDMSTTRADVDEMSSGMGLLTEALGRDAWNHAIITLTFADVVAGRIMEEEGSEETKVKMFKRKVEQWREKVRLALERAGVQPDVIPQIPIEPTADYLTPHLPHRDHWLGYLWLQFLFRIKDEGKPAILITNQHRLWSSEALQPSELKNLFAQAKNPSQVPLVIDRGAVTAISAMVGIATSAVSKFAGAAYSKAVVGATVRTPWGLTIAAGLVGGAVCYIALTKILEKRKIKKE